MWFCIQPRYWSRHYSKQQFIDTNISGTLNLLEAAVAHGVKSFIFTSTTSTYGHALRPDPALPAAWVTEDLVPIPKNIYGITKLAAENLCKLMHDKENLPVLILRPPASSQRKTITRPCESGIPTATLSSSNTYTDEPN